MSGNFVTPCERMHCENLNARTLPDPPAEPEELVDESVPLVVLPSWAT